MGRSFFIAGIASLIFLSGCADSLIVREPATVDRAGYSPNPAGHIPANPDQQSPITRATNNDSNPF